MSPDLPLRVTTAERAAVLRQSFAGAGYREARLCEVLGVPRLDSVDHPPFKLLASRVDGAAPLDVLSRLFLFGHPMPSTIASDALGAAAIDAFRDADLLRDWCEPGPLEGQLFSPVRIVPVAVPGRSPEELLLVGDRADRPDGSRFTPFPDIVFSGHNPLTRQFLQLLPKRKTASVLDLCAGTGVGALALAPFAAECTAVDIAGRSVHFAGFNAWLNETPNVSIACGDLYAPVRGRRFERIVAHPPYVPALMQQLTYRDGGETGDAIIRGIVKGVPEHLDAGGTFHLLCLGMDTAEHPFEQRVREWLGEAGRQFDVVFALDSRTAPEQIAAGLVQQAGGSARELDHWRDLFERLHVREFVYGAIVARRFDASRGTEPMTRRVVLGPDSSAEGFDWMFQWFDWLRRPALEERVLGMRPRLDPALSLEVRHRVEGGTFEPVSYALANGGHPFFARLEPEPWVVALVSELDGSRTIREAFRSAAARGRVADGFGESDLVRLMCFLLERGCLKDTTP